MAVDYVKMGRIMKQQREKLEMSQEELGRKTLTSNVHISNIESGSRAPSLDLFVEIANALGLSADDLLVNSLDVSSSIAGQKVHAIFQGCNHDEEAMLLRILAFIKELFIEFNI